MIKLFLLSFASCIISLTSVFLIKKILGQQLLDIPNQRSSHSQPTPRGGGMGFIIAFAVTNSLVKILDIDVNPHFELWLILTPLIIIGLIDDYKGVSATIRYLVQIVSASLAVICFGYFSFFGENNLGIIGNLTMIIFTLIAITAIINFYNFMDGLDGIVAGCTIVQLTFFSIYLNEPILWLLIAAVLGFLWWNWSPAKIFMGDAGSTVLGATIGILFLLHQNPVSAWSSLAVTLPLVADAIYTILRRLLNRENIFQAHRSHLYQRFQQSGWSHGTVATTYIFVNILICAIVSLLGTIGVMISFFTILLAIVLGEFYLQSQKQKVT